MKKLIPYARQSINEDDIEAVVRVLRSDFIAQGPEIERLEKEIAAYCGAKYAVAVASATAGLHIACLALDMKNGDLLWTSPITFVASANCARYCGANVDFVDVDPGNINMSVTELEKKLSGSAKKPKVVVPVHFTGQSCDMEKIGSLAKKHGFSVIEDAAHAFGGTYRGKKVGSCEHSDIVVLSFQAVKVVTAGEGGLILTNRKDLFEKLMRLRTHGLTRDPAQMVRPPKGPWELQQIDLGFHYRITDSQAALALSQFRRIEQFLSRRQEIFDRYQKLLAPLPVNRLTVSPDGKSGHHLYVVRLKPDHLKKIGKTHRQVFEELRENGIGVNLHYIPVHTQPYYEQLGFKAGDFPQAEAYASEAITLPFFYGLTDEEQDQVVAMLKKVLAA